MSFTDRLSPYFEGSIELDEGFVKDGYLFRRVRDDDFEGLMTLEKPYKDLALTPEEVTEDLALFPQLQVVAETLDTRQLVAKAAAVLVKPAVGEDIEAIVQGEEGWYGSYSRKAADGPYHEAIGVSVDKKRNSELPRNICMVLFRAIVENTLRGDGFERLRWSSSLHLLWRRIPSMLGWERGMSFEAISQRFSQLPDEEKIVHVQYYIEKVMEGGQVDVPFSMHSQLLKISDGKARFTGINRCRDDFRSLGFGARMMADEAVDEVVEWRKSLA